MCIIPGDRMAEAMRDELQRVDVMAKTLNGIDAFFAPTLARAAAQSRKIGDAVQSWRDADREYVAERWHEIEEGRMPANLTDAEVSAFVAVLDRIDEADDAMSTQA